VTVSAPAVKKRMNTFMPSSDLQGVHTQLKNRDYPSPCAFDLDHGCPNFRKRKFRKGTKQTRG
jgi:hypothetical protein